MCSKNVITLCICKQVAIKYVVKGEHDIFITMVTKRNSLPRYCRKFYLNLLVPANINVNCLYLTLRFPSLLRFPSFPCNISA